jgi:DNA-binding NarL/FixJ family response regulator
MHQVAQNAKIFVARDRQREFNARVNENESAQVAALVRDLLFASRITATAKAIGIEVKILRDVSQLASISAKKLLVDLNQQNFLDAAAAWKKISGGKVIGFVAHTDAATIARASEMGIDEVLVRSAFVNRLADLLRSVPSPGTPGEG